MNKIFLEKIVIEHAPTGVPVNAAVIWLHGLGADGNDFAAIIPELQLPKESSIRFIFPHAPIRPVTINMGLETRSWYDILSIGEQRDINKEQLQQSCQQLEHLIDEQINLGIPSNKILIAGFSQGGAVAISTALRYNKPLAGLLALSTYIPVIEWIEQQRNLANYNIPIMMGHGTQDPVVAYTLAISSRRKLTELGYNIKWHEYVMPHTVCLEQIKDISKWMLPLLT